jgi:lipid II:glycine glycyltransferase (peptidoglycan interpeptide bridge formation enzyme)
MLSVITKNMLLYSRQEVWFYNGGKIKSTSNDMYYQSFIKPVFDVKYLRETQTTLINLLEDSENLFNGIKPGYRYEIRRAEKLNAAFQVIEKPDNECLRYYLESYAEFAKTKELDPSLNFARLKAFSGSGALRITKVLISGQVVTMHSYLVDDNERVVLLYSHHNVAYTDKVARGFANKFHHWSDMKYFKEKGIKYYDMGGLDFVNTPGIAEFKKSFGGTEHIAYNFQTTSRLYGLLKK